MTARSWWVVMLFVGGAILGAVLGQCARPGPNGLLPAVEKAVTTHEVLTVIDTAAVTRFREAAREAALVRTEAERRAKAAEVRAVLAERSAETLHRLADSLALVASAATASADSTRVAGAAETWTLWRAAYTARTAEAESLSVANVAKDTALAAMGVALAAADRRSVATDSALARTVKRAERGDSVIAKLLPLAEKYTAPCRVLFVSCPSRKASFIAGGVTVVTAIVVLKNGLTLRLP